MTENEMTKDFYIALSNGTFDSTTAQDLDHMFQTIAADPDRSRLVVHFHGGLVNKASGMEIANSLLPVYRKAGGYPIFFVWEAGLTEIVMQNLRDIFDERIFQRLIQRVTQFAVGKVQQQLSTGARGERLTLPPLQVIQDTVRQATNQAVPFAHLDPSVLPPNESLSKAQEDQFREEMEADPVITQESIAIANALQSKETADAEHVASRGARTQGSAHTLMSPTVIDDIRGESAMPAGATAASRGLLSVGRIVTGGVRILKNVITRFANRRGHGLYATVVEEILREFYVANVGGVLWTLMKDATQRAFGGDPAVHGGTAFLRHLKTYWTTPGEKRPVVLVGHSTGAVYICNLLKASVNELPPELKFDVVLLAPACTFDLFAEALGEAKDRINDLRVFAMHDPLELADELVPVLYPHSLLYFVSGVVEASVDMPLVGMERYYSGNAPYDGVTIKTGSAFLAGAPHRSVWSEATGGTGLASASHSHGDFDNDPVTLQSLQSIISKGW